jgi:hypothetical protein
MSLAVMLAALIVAVVAFGTMFTIALVAAPRGITSGPTVTLARALFIVGGVALAIALAALAWGLVSSWA